MFKVVLSGVLFEQLFTGKSSVMLKLQCLWTACNSGAGDLITTQTASVQNDHRNIHKLTRSGWSLPSSGHKIGMHCYTMPPPWQRSLTR